MNLGLIITLLKIFEESGLTKRTPPAISEELKKKKFFHELGLKIPDE